MGLSELIDKNKYADIEFEIGKGLAYGVVGELMQPYAEIPEDPKKTITVFVYINTEIEILDDKEKIENTVDIFNMIQGAY